MSVNVRDHDAISEAIATVFHVYAETHPHAIIDVLRYSPVSVRVRVVDPDFRGKTRADRHKMLWPHLFAIDEDAREELTMVLLLTPEECETSPANRDFDSDTFAQSMIGALRTAGGQGSSTS